MECRVRRAEGGHGQRSHLAWARLRLRLRAKAGRGLGEGWAARVGRACERDAGGRVHGHSSARTAIRRVRACGRASLAC